MNLRVVAWNAESMFAPYTPDLHQSVTYHSAQTKRATPEDALRVITSLDADVIVVPEFGASGCLLPAHQSLLEKLGYHVIETPYEDQVAPVVEMAVLSRLPIVRRHALRLGKLRTNNEVILKMGDRELRVIAVHLDDQTETRRLAQARDLVSAINRDVATPTIVLGDFNAMDERSWFARVSRSRVARRLTRLVRHVKLRSVALRLHDMALGTTIRFIEHQTKLRNLDPGHHLTISGKQAGLEWMPSIRLAKIDWIFGSSHISVRHYRVWKDVGSDHRPVIADIVIS